MAYTPYSIFFEDPPAPVPPVNPSSEPIAAEPSDHEDLPPPDETEALPDADQEQIGRAHV